MLFACRLRILFVFMLVLSVSFSFVGCKERKTTINISSERINYNNIYDFAHSNFWVHGKTIYYAKSGLFDDTYYQFNDSGKQVVTTENKIRAVIDKNTDSEILSGIQVYDDDMYFWYLTKNNNELYRYNKADNKFKKLVSINEVVNNWAIVDDKVVYSTFVEEFDIDMNSLWFCDLISGKTQKIAHKTFAFGICDNKVRYVQNVDNGESLLYEFDLETSKEAILCSFDGLSKGYNYCNFTKEYVVFVSDKLHTVEVKTGKQNNFKLPENIKFFNCYEQYLFACTDTDVYRINISTGATELLCEMKGECNLLYSISDECAIAIFYDLSSVTTKVDVYAVYADGNPEKLFNI